MLTYLWGVMNFLVVEDEDEIIVFNEMLCVELLYFD